MKTGNITFLNTICLYFVGVEYEKNQPVLSNYISHLQEFNAVLINGGKDKEEEFKSGLKNSLLVLLNNTNSIDLNNWFNDNSYHYLENDVEVIALLKLIWYFYFDEDNFIIEEWIGAKLIKK